MATFFCDALVMSRSHLGDTDLSLVLFTRQYGKLHARLRGARKPLSKLAGSLEPFSRGTVVCAQGIGGLTIIGTETIPLKSTARTHLLAIGTASVASEFIIRLTEERHRDVRLFQLLHDFLLAIEQCASQPTSLSLVRTWFLVNALELHGSGFELSVCVVCRKAPTVRELAFSCSHGGIVSGACRRIPTDAVELSPDAVKLLRLVRGMQVSLLSRVHASSRIIAEATQAAERAYTFLAESSSPVLDFLSSVKAK